MINEPKDLNADVTEVENSRSVSIGMQRQNAERFRLIIDEFVASNQEGFISCNKVGLANKTLQNRLSEALKFLAIHAQKDLTGKHKYSRADYAMFKARIKISREIDGVRILFKKQVTSINSEVIDFQTQNESIKQILGAKTVRELVTDFLADDSRKFLEVNSKKDLNGKHISDIDTAWISKTLSDVGIEFEIGSDFLRCLK